MATGAKKQNAFMKWYESYNGKKVVGMVYSLGASVVIVGALFKILHLPGASQMLFAGMMTEAFLFAIGCLDKPHPEFHWEEVFPQLLEQNAIQAEVWNEYKDRPRPTLLGAGASAAAKESSSVNPLSEKEMENLKNGIQDLAKTAVQLGELGKVATSTTKLAEKAEAAADAADRFANAANTLGTKNESLAASMTVVAQNMETAAASTKSYTQSVETVASKAAQLGSIYEQQLAALQSAAASAQQLQISTAEAAKEQAAYAAASKTLAKQVADLNAIYGNMLNAVA